MYGDSTNMVSWGDYEGVDGFGIGSQSDVDSLNKALEAGRDRDPPGAAVPGDGFALRVESLERTLKNTTYRMEHIRFWKSIPKLPAYNTVEEHNELSSYGDNEDAYWVDEGDLPEEADSTYERKHAYIKYLGVTGRVTHVMSIIKPAHGNVIAQETVNKTMHLLKILERALFYGDSNLSALQFDGFEKLISDLSPVANIVDLRGLPLSEDHLTDGALTVSDAPNYGTPTHFHCNPKVKSDLCKTFFPKERYDLFQKTSKGMVGLDIRGFTSPAGDVLFEPNSFVNDGGAPTATAVGDAAKRPGTPTVTTTALTPPDGASQFGDDDAGAYFYIIQAVNRYGRSAPVILSAGPAAVTVISGDKVIWGMTPGGSTAVDYYAVYRSRKDGPSGSERLILRIKNTAGASEETLNDYNASLPYCSSGFLFQQNLECMSFKQLAPMVKIPLATVDASIRWMQLLYGVPVLYTPGKVVLFRNIGRSAGYVGQP